jgi:6-phosphogluconolactonase (cycloisomerase 2 family)
MGRFLYSAALTGTGPSLYSVTSQAIDPASGNLTPAPGSPYPIPSGCTLAVTPDGRFVYAAGSGSISAFSVDQTTGALTPVAGSPFAYTDPQHDGSDPIAIDPTQQFLYIFGNLNQSPTVLAYTIDPTTGALNPFNATPTTLGDIAIKAIGTGDLFVIFPLVH